MGAAATARPRESRGTAPHRTVITTPRQGGAATSRSARAVPAHSSFVGRMMRLKHLATSVVAAVLLASTAVAAPPGTPIANRGQVQYAGSAGLTTIYSNEVALRRRTDAVARDAHAATRGLRARQRRHRATHAVLRQRRDRRRCLRPSAATANRSRSANRYRSARPRSYTAARPSSSTSSTPIATSTPLRSTRSPSR